MLLRIHRNANTQDVVGICDRELIDTTLSEGELSILISRSFFGDQVATEEEILNTLKTYGNINMFGERCISLAIKHGYLDRESCRMIAGVPHAIIL
jgi:uncharacterized protein